MWVGVIPGKGNHAFQSRECRAFLLCSGWPALAHGLDRGQKRENGQLESVTLGAGRQGDLTWPSGHLIINTLYWCHIFFDVYKISHDKKAYLVTSFS